MRRKEVIMARYEYTINSAKQEIKNSISVYMMKDEAGNYIMPENKKNPFYIVGAPGIGKTEMASQIASELGIGFMATSLSHHTRNSVLGLPVITDFKGEKSTEYTISDILLQVMKKCEEGQKEGILLIDEFASMSEALVAPMLAFLQNKCIGNHYLPEGWVLILCSNPPEYNETARVFGAAVMDRVRIMNVKYSKQDFLLYAKQSGMHPVVIGYIENNDRNVYVCDQTENEQIVVTTRGWENLSQCLYGYEKLGMEVTDSLIYQFIKSESIAGDFYNYYMLCSSVLGERDIHNIINGINIDSNIEKIKNMEFNKKLQVSDIIINKLSNEAKSDIVKSELADYLGEWIDEWDNNSECMGEGIYDSSYMENTIKSRLGLPGIGFSNMYAPAVFSTRKCDYDEENMLKNILKIVNLRKKENNTNETVNSIVLKAMKEYQVTLSNIVKNGLNKQNKKVSNVINCLSNVGDSNVKDYFIRKLNQDDNLLYVLSKEYNKEYTEELSAIYGQAS